MSNTEYGLRRIALSEPEIDMLTLMVMGRITSLSQQSRDEHVDVALVRLRTILDKFSL